MDQDNLKLRIDQADAIERMTNTEGWKILKELLVEQLEAYKIEVLFHCDTWDEYQSKKAKAWGISLILTNVEDYINQGKEAEEELNKLDS